MKAKHLLVIVFLVMAGCKKEASKLNSDIQGTWELVSSDGAWFGHQEYQPGNGNTFNFNGNTYLRIVVTPDSTYQYTGTFNIYTGKPCDLAKEQTLINFNDGNGPGSFILSDGKLTIGTTECVADGGSSTYKKIQ
jgi:hypothetical protein